MPAARRDVPRLEVGFECQVVGSERLVEPPGAPPSLTAYAVVLGRQPGEEDNPTAFSVSEDAEPAQGRVKGVAKQYRKESRGRAAPSFEQLTRGSRNGVARI